MSLPLSGLQTGLMRRPEWSLQLGKGLELEVWLEERSEVWMGHTQTY